LGPAARAAQAGFLQVPGRIASHAAKPRLAILSCLCYRVQSLPANANPQEIQLKTTARNLTASGVFWPFMPRSAQPSSPRQPRPPRASGELALIDHIRARASSIGRGGALRLGIGDDCAILAPPRGHEILVTTDMSLERRHFRRDWHPAQSIGHRTLARGLSDLAAMGARPLAAFLSLALPRSAADDAAWLDGFLDGLLALAAASKTPLAGGDTAESPSGHILADIVLLGSAPTGKALRRSGARPGDRLFITGTLGGAAAELAGLATQHENTGGDASKNASAARRKNADSSIEHPHLYPQARLAAGQALLRRNLATACIDISDGLSTDLAHLCDASNVAAEIDAARLPIHPLARALGQPAAQAAALHGGEDYELLFTAPPDGFIPRALAGVPVTCIGSIERAGRGRPQMSLLEDGNSMPLEPRGWEHLH
jgi:thiamine-monophosphate kinase